MGGNRTAQIRLSELFQGQAARARDTGKLLIFYWSSHMITKSRIHGIVMRNAS